MKLLLPSRISEQLTEALRAGGDREVGGILMGEHVAVGTFRVVEITVQRKGGTFASFVRFAEAIFGPLEKFFRARHCDYVRFNYLGEWHSHPSFALHPSAKDHQSMLEIVRDPEVGARFAVLLLVKLDSGGEFRPAVCVYEAGGLQYPGTVEAEA